MPNFWHWSINFTSVRKQKVPKTQNFKIRETCLLRFYADNNYLRLIWNLFFFNFTVNVYMDRILFIWMYVWNVQGTLFKVIEMIEFFTPHRTHSQNVHQLSQICYMSTKHIHVFLIVEKDKFQCLCTCVYAFFFYLICLFSLNSHIPIRPAFVLTIFTIQFL